MSKIKINAELVIIGNGDSINNGSVIIEDNKIIYTGESEHAPNAEETFDTKVVMPGLWECHGHFVGIRKPSLEATVFTRPQVAAIRSVWDVKEALLGGVTTVREVGGMGIYLNQAIQENMIIGPRIYGAGRILSTTGGHGDIHNLNLDVVSLLNHVAGNQFGELVDGVAECYKGVRKQLREGAEVIKFCASGGVMSEIDNPIHQQFSLEEQKAIVDEARRSEVAVAAHCHGAAGIKAALDAGVTSIEHGTYLNDELIDQMLETETILVPTRYVVEKLKIGAEKMGAPPYAMAKLNALDDQHVAAIKLAIKKGVTIAMGTDMFSSGPGGIFRWGDNAMELGYLVNLGMKPMDAIVSATGNGPLTLGKRAPKSGLLKEGYDADMLLLNKNPLDNINVLSDRDTITKIIKQGIVVK